MILIKKLYNTFLGGWELSDPDELSDPLEDEELDPEDELFDELEEEAEVLPLGFCLGGISEKSHMVW